MADITPRWLNPEQAAAYRRSPEWAAKRPATQANYRVYLRDLEEIAVARTALAAYDTAKPKETTP